MVKEWQTPENSNQITKEIPIGALRYSQNSIYFIFHILKLKFPRGIMILLPTFDCIWYLCLMDLQCAKELTLQNVDTPYKSSAAKPLIFALDDLFVTLNFDFEGLHQMSSSLNLNKFIHA